MFATAVRFSGTTFLIWRLGDNLSKILGLVPLGARSVGEIVRLPRLPVGCVLLIDADGVCLLIGLPMREVPEPKVLPELTRVLEPKEGRFTLDRPSGPLVAIELPIRGVLPELMRVLEPENVGILAPELAPAELLLPRERLDGVWVRELIPGREVVIRLDVTLLD